MTNRAMWGSLVVALSALTILACGDDGDGDDDTSGAGASSASGSSSTSGTGGQASLCELACEQMWPAGITSAQLMADCVVCGACYDACDGGSGDVCPSGGELGCSAGTASCDECLQGTCAYAVDLPTMTTTGVCAAEAKGCIDNNDCLELLDCLSMCP